MRITTFKISSDKTKLELTIEDAASVNSLLLWDNKTYKNFDAAINLNSKLTGNTVENIEITLSDLNLNFFDGIYFIEAETPTELSLEYAYDLLKYQECIIDKVSYIATCDDCLDEEIIPLVNAHSIFKALQYSLEQRFISEILKFIKILDKFCNDDCKTCGENILSNNSEDILNPNNIIVNIDGGNA